MRKNNVYSESRFNQRVFFISGAVVVAILFGILFFQISYVENEGFNPSDDGVVLAQSFRIINGEIPHKDFIAIRPVFSGILHTIHFFDPMPLEISARWFTILEYFIYSFFWVYILLKILEVKIHSRIRFLVLTMSAGIFAFFSNMNKYNLFTWTTIDAVFLTVIAFAFLFISTIEEHRLKKMLYTISGLFFISLASITKQNFAIITILVYAVVIYKGLKNKKYLNSFFILILGSFPVWGYLMFVISHNAFGLFIQQMTGRTEFFQTGILQFVKSFFKARLLILNLPTLCLILYLYLKNKSWIYRTQPILLNIKQRKTIIGVVLFYNAIAVFFSYYYFLKSDTNIYTVPFEFFWILFVISSLIYFSIPLKFNQKLLIFSGLLIPWCSSISLGDNSPVFTTGLMLTQIIFLSAFLISQYNLRFSLSIFTGIKTKAIVLLLLIGFVVSAIYGQQQVNYRDRKSAELTACLCSISEEFGTIHTNKTTFGYLADFINLYSLFPGMKNNFVMIPNNAMMYPAMNSRNPFPLDWIQPDEYKGSEKYLSKKIEEILDRKNIYLVIDIFNSKEMAIHLRSLNLSPYKYLKEFKNRFLEIPVNSKYFRVYKSI